MCDIFLVLITHFALRSKEVEKEVLTAQKLNKSIIPCKYIKVEWKELSWGLDNIQGVEFGTGHSLVRELSPLIVPTQPVTGRIGEIPKDIQKKMDTSSEQEAIQCIDRALQIDPEYALPWYRKGWTLVKLGRYNEALRYFDRSKQLGYEG